MRHQSYLHFAIPLMLVGLVGCNGGTTCDVGTAMNGAACVTSNDCCVMYSTTDPTKALTCSRTGRTCRPTSDLVLGETCTTDNLQCASRSCDVTGHFCTLACVADTDCAASTMTACTPSLGAVGGWECQPTCKTSDDCKVYGASGDGNNGPSLTCQSITTHDGVTATVCAPPA